MVKIRSNGLPSGTWIELDGKPVEMPIHKITYVVEMGKPCSMIIETDAFVEAAIDHDGLLTLVQAPT